MTPYGLFDVPVSQVKPGTLLQADGGFTCLKTLSVHAVQADEAGDLYISCGCGQHYLDGQRTPHDTYSGLRLAPGGPHATA